MWVWLIGATIGRRSCREGRRSASRLRARSPIDRAFSSLTNRRASSIGQPANRPRRCSIAWKTVLAHPVRASVLGVGFGLGVGVMATLLGVGEVVLEQARAPALAGGGSMVVVSPTGVLTSARFVLNAIRQAANTGSSTPD